MTREKWPRGRPKDDAKKTALLDAARSLLLARGPDVTIDEIAASAGIAKATVYANFAGKNALIEAVIRRESDMTITDEQLARLANAPLADVLFKFGVQFVRFINHRDLLGWDRLIASLEAHQTELPKRFFDLGPGRGQRLLTKIIADAVASGQVETDDAAYAADALTGLWLGFVNLEIKLGVRQPMEANEIKQRVRRGIDIFMKIYGKHDED